MTAVQRHGVLRRLSGRRVTTQRGVAAQDRMLWPGLIHGRANKQNYKKNKVYIDSQLLILFYLSFGEKNTTCVAVDQACTCLRADGFQQPRQSV